VISPSWSSLNRFGQSRILRSSYFWLAAVPLCAKILLKVGNEHSITVLGSTFTITLGLPFSWKFFFYSSVVFSIASFLYSLSCPPIVRDYQRFSDFIGEGKDGRQIQEAFGDLLTGALRDKKTELLRFIDTYIQPIERGEETTVDIESERSDSALGQFYRVMLLSLEIPKKNLSGTFWYVRNLADMSAPTWRWLCAIFYMIGFVLLLVVFIQNFFYVVYCS